MDPLTYAFGIISGLIAGIIFGSGTILMKLAINRLPDDSELMKSLIKNRLWLTGFFFQFILGSIFLFIAQFLIGPALVPGLTSVGLVILAIGSVKIIGESLNRSEYLGITLMIVAIIFLSFSGLSIDITDTSYLEFNFLFRAYLFSGILFLLAGIFVFLQKRTKRFRGILFALASGVLFSIENLWLGIVIVIFTNLIVGVLIIEEIVVFIIAFIFLFVINFYGVITLQKAFQTGQASNLSPIQTVPVQIGPIFIYFLVFLLVPPSILSIVLLVSGITIILISSFLLGKRQAQLEEIK